MSEFSPSKYQIRKSRDCGWVSEAKSDDHLWFTEYVGFSLTKWGAIYKCHRHANKRKRTWDKYQMEHPVIELGRLP